jgi:sigma-54 dependent transcriptional regulator, acetoin dehydrogenase operon transcriptional activator AcoR
LLVNFFIDEAMHPEVQAVDYKAVQMLWESPYGWPANVQELRSIVTRAVTSASNERRQVILKKDIESSLATNCADSSSDQLPCKGLRGLKKAECETILKALTESFGNKAKAARKLKISRPTLDSKCKGYGIDPKAFNPKASSLYRHP